MDICHNTRHAEETEIISKERAHLTLPQQVQKRLAMDGVIVKNLSLLQRFYLLCLSALVVFSIAFGVIITTLIERNMLARSKQITAAIVSEEVRNEFTLADFREPKTGPNYDVFTERVSHLSLGPNVERVKIWNREEVVVWANDERLVGKQFPDNKELITALGGEITSELSRLEKEEQEFEAEFERLLELYVPVRFDMQTDVGVVFEIYQNLDPLYVDVSRNRRVVWLSTIVGFSFLFLVLLGLVRGASRRIERQHQDILRSEERYRNLLASAQDAIISINPDGSILFFNKAAERTFGYSAQEIIGEPATILMPEHYRSNHQSAIKRFCETNESTIIGKTVEMEGLRKDGQYFPLELSLSISGEAENLIITGILRDISERKAMQAQLIEAEKQATVSLVAGSIGHELNNIVTGLMGFAELLQKSPDDKLLAQESAELFGKESQRLKVHASNLLTLSRPQKPEMKPVSLDSLLDRVTEFLVSSGLLKWFVINKNYSPGLPLVFADEMQLEQVIRNLEINAAHAMGDRGTLTLGTKFSKDESSAEFWISDTGHGIPDDKREQIFLPFYTTKEKGQGTGLGMYIIKQTVEQHKGYLRLESRVGVGTTITIGIPLAR